MESWPELWANRVWIAAVCAALSACAAAGLCALWGPVDGLRERGLHTRPTPTSGGLAVMLGVGVGMTALTLLGSAPPGETTARLGALALMALGVGLFGAWDDLADLGPRTKLGVQAALAAGFALFVSRIEALPLAPGLTLELGPVAGTLGTALWIVVATNAVNFIDGADGVAPGAVIIAWLGLAVAAPAPVAAVAGLCAAAALGFLPWNLPGGRLFQGDAGALFSGFMLAGLAVLASQGGDQSGASLSVYFTAFCALPMLADVLLTLADRARRGQTLFAAHREHLYQRWLAARPGRSHAALSLQVWALSALSTGAAILAEGAAAGWRPLIFVLAALAAGTGWVVLRKRLAG